MLFITLVSLLAFISINQASDLQKYFNLIDLNNDGKVFSDEIYLFLNKFYEEEPDQVIITPTLSLQIEKNIIQRYNHNSINNYLTLLDLERLFLDLYGIQNPIPTFLSLGLEPEQVHLSYTHNLSNEMYISFVTRERPSSNLRPIIKYCDQGCLVIGDTTTYDIDNWHYWIHFIYIKGLEAGVKYNYQLGFIDSDNQTIRHIFSNDLWTFKTLPLIEKQAREIVYSLSRREESYKHKLSDCLLVCPHLTD